MRHQQVLALLIIIFSVGFIFYYLHYSSLESPRDSSIISLTPCLLSKSQWIRTNRYRYSAWISIIQTFFFPTALNLSFFHDALLLPNHSFFIFQDLWPCIVFQWHLPWAVRPLGFPLLPSAIYILILIILSGTVLITLILQKD